MEKHMPLENNNSTLCAECFIRNYVQESKNIHSQIKKKYIHKVSVSILQFL